LSWCKRVNTKPQQNNCLTMRTHLYLDQNRYLIWGLVSKVWWMGLANMPFLWGTWALAHVYVSFFSGMSLVSPKPLTHAPLDSCAFGAKLTHTCIPQHWFTRWLRFAHTLHVTKRKRVVYLNGFNPLSNIWWFSHGSFVELCKTNPAATKIDFSQGTPTRAMTGPTPIHACGGEIHLFGCSRSAGYRLARPLALITSSLHAFNS
jgi:hypothetical protein